DAAGAADDVAAEVALDIDEGDALVGLEGGGGDEVAAGQGGDAPHADGAGNRFGDAEGGVDLAVGGLDRVEVAADEDGAVRGDLAEGADIASGVDHLGIGGDVQGDDQVVAGAERHQ